MRHEISGEIAQRVRLEFDAGETAWASRGSLMGHSRHIRWNLRVPGGIGGAVRRSMAGEGLSLTYLEADADGAYTMLAANAPGHLTTWDLEQDGPIVTTRGAFMAAWGEQTDITVIVARRAGAALFGGAGLFLQRISGRGTVLVHGSGDFEALELAEGEQLLVSTGNLAAFADSVDYDIEGVGGCRRTLFGGEGFFMTRLSGPGRVLLQTLKREAGAEG